MKFTQKILLLLSSLFVAFSAGAVDLSKVPDVRNANLYKVNEEGFQRDERPKHCTYANNKLFHDKMCYDFVLTLSEAGVRYANTDIHLGKPLTKGNKARENKESLQNVINEIKSVYAGTETSILNKKPELNRSLAGLFNTFNDAIEDVKPYVLSIANGHYDKETLKTLDTFMNVFQNGWNKSVETMILYKGISEEKADGSTAYYKQELTKIRHIITQLNKYYQ